MEGFGLTTLRSLSRRARRTLEEDGPDAALSLFGQSAGVMEPLAIFRLVFTTALDLVESFERLVPDRDRAAVAAGGSTRFGSGQDIVVQPLRRWVPGPPGVRRPRASCRRVGQRMGR